MAIPGAVPAMLTLTLACVLLAGAQTRGRAPAEPRGFLMKELVHDGAVYPYVVYVPRNYDPAKEWPCILFLHGRGESGGDGLKQVIQGIGSAIQWNAAEWPFIVVMPQKPTPECWWEDHTQPVMSMLAAASRDYRLDGTRTYLTGLSQGGHGTWAIASRHPDVFAAIAPICGFPGDIKVDDIAGPLTDMPVWAFHGLEDKAVPPLGTTAITDALAAARKGRATPAELKVSLFPGVDHNSWDRAYRESKLAEWFLAHRRPTPAP